MNQKMGGRSGGARLDKSATQRNGSIHRESQKAVSFSDLQPCAVCVATGLPKGKIEKVSWIDFVFGQWTHIWPSGDSSMCVKAMTHELNKAPMPSRVSIECKYVHEPRRHTTQ